MSRPDLSSRRRRHVLVTLLGALIGSGIALGQGRTIDRIRTPEDTRGEVLDDRPDLERTVCEGAVREIAAAYGPDDLGPWLHETFPNRAELLDALARLDLRVTALELRVESIERIVVLPWRRLDGEVFADCVATVRTRLVFDDPDTGERTVGLPRQAQWRIRFTSLEGEPGRAGR